MPPCYGIHYYEPGESIIATYQTSHGFVQAVNHNNARVIVRGEFDGEFFVYACGLWDENAARVEAESRATEEIDLCPTPPAR